MIFSLERRFDPRIVQFFELTNPPVELPGLSADLLADLYDLTRNFGIKDAAEKIARIWTSEPKEIHVSISLKKDNYSIVIIGSGGSTRAGAIPFQVGKNTFIFWDNRISVVDMEVFIQEIDRFMQEQGCIDQSTGNRMTMLFRDTAEKKYIVDQVFVDEGTTMPALPGGPDIETLRRQFDQPEKVAILELPFGGKSLCHVRDLGFMEKRKQAMNAVLHAHGITSLEQIGDLPMEEVMIIRQEISKVSDEL